MLNQANGLCECGCSLPAPIATMTRTRIGHVRGEPIRFIYGHQHRLSPAWQRVDMGYRSPCLIWQGALTDDGYGRARIGGRKKRLTHVLMWEYVNGPVPAGLELDHLCRVRACGEPAHLEPVTTAVNARRGANAKLTEDQVLAIRATPNMTNLALAQRYGVSKSLISHIRTGRNWKPATMTKAK